MSAAEALHEEQANSAPIRTNLISTPLESKTLDRIECCFLLRGRMDASHCTLPKMVTIKQLRVRKLFVFVILMGNMQAEYRDGISRELHIESIPGFHVSSLECDGSWSQE